MQKNILKVYNGNKIYQNEFNKFLFSLILSKYHISSLYFSGVGNRHVQAHELARWPEDDGGNKESGRIRGLTSRQLHRQNTGQSGKITLLHYGSESPMTQ